MTEVRIFQPAPNAMQTGPAGSRKWVLEYEPASAKEIDPLMGWVSSSDTLAQVRLAFDSKEQAVAYAERKGISYQVREPNQRRIRIKNYSDNFSFRQVS